MKEQGVIFKSNKKQLVAIEHWPVNSKPTQGVVLVVGGPQTRVGSHRLFVQLSRALAKQGIGVFRFDYCGAGDSEGEVQSFKNIQVDIDAAIQTFKTRHEELESIALWGLCDAASAILLYLNEFEESKILKKIILVNPWVRQEHTLAQTYLGTYYLKRLFSKSFWRKFLLGKVKTKATLEDIKIFRQQSKQGRSTQNTNNFVMKMLAALTNFNGSTSIILSGQDLTADEFRQLTKTDKRWKKIIKADAVSEFNVNSADHTFSAPEAKEKLIHLTSSILMNAKS